MVRTEEKVMIVARVRRQYSERRLRFTLSAEDEDMWSGYECEWREMTVMVDEVKVMVTLTGTMELSHTNSLTWISNSRSFGQY